MTDTEVVITRARALTHARLKVLLSGTRVSQPLYKEYMLDTSGYR